MESDTNKRGKSDRTSLTYRTCRTPSYMQCDGMGHYWAIWDEDINRHVPVDGQCPHRHHNRALDTYWSFRDSGLSPDAALALVRAHGGDL
jgi:hypothetical protein